MPQQHLDYHSPLGKRTRPPTKRIATLACVLAATVAYNLFLARWKVVATVPSPAAFFIDQALAPLNVMLAGIALSVALWLPIRGWSLLWCLALCLGIPLLGWLAVGAVR